MTGQIKYGAIANSDEQRIKEFAKKEFSKVLDTCKNSDALNKNLDNRIFKLKAWKSLGSFTALLLTVKPIDTFVVSFCKNIFLAISILFACVEIIKSAFKIFYGISFIINITDNAVISYMVFDKS